MRKFRAHCVNLHSYSPSCFQVGSNLICQTFVIYSNMKAMPNIFIHFWITIGQISEEQAKPENWDKGAAPAGASCALSTVEGGIGAQISKKEVIKSTVVLARYKLLSKRGGLSNLRSRGRGQKSWVQCSVADCTDRRTTVTRSATKLVLARFVANCEDL